MSGNGTRVARPDELEATLARLNERHTLLLNVRTMQARKRDLLEQVAEIDRSLEQSADAVRLVMAEIAGAP